jgi:hypothetical protein
VRNRRIDRTFLFLGQGMLLVFFSLYFLHWFSLRNVVRIDHIAINGGESVDKTKVMQLASALLSENIFWHVSRRNKLFYPKNTLERRIGALDAHISRVEAIPEPNNTLAIVITEYTAKNLWCPLHEAQQLGEEFASIDVCYLASEEGYIYAIAPNYSGHPFRIYRTSIAGREVDGSPIGHFILPNAEFTSINAFISELKKLNIDVHEVQEMNPGDYRIISNKPWTISWSSQKDPHASVEYLNLLLDEVAQRRSSTTTFSSIDLRFGNKIFYR